MIYSRKLKPDRDFTGLLPAFFSILLSGLVAAIFGPEEAINVLGAIGFVYSIFGFIAVYRTKNSGYTFSAFYILGMSLYLFALHVDENSRKVLIQTPLSKLFLVITVFLLIILIYMLFTRKIKWRGREILELAAVNVNEGPDTYTDRPRPIANLELTRDEVENFAEFLKRNLVAMPYYEQERILFVPVRMGQEYFYLFNNNVNYWDKTWVAFDFDGKVSAHISKKDYLEYRKNLEFDPLCESLGKLFIEFFEEMRKDEASRIIDKLNEVKIGFFS
ncbi:MAG: hypothetical protein RDU14_05155 [Melioribacteraceae bacterium]|nr:hypothetical protein [Melioribacteraceae bacterium]